jgi:hypothetical protein
MGVDTKAILPGRIDVMDLARDLIEVYGTDRNSVKVTLTHSEGYFNLHFDHRHPAEWQSMTYTERRDWYKVNHRMMGVFYDNQCDYEDVTDQDCTFLSLGCRGNSVEIMESLIRKYGAGWIMRNDSTDEWEEFSRSMDWSSANES